jgi:hypothetical protein
MKDKTFAPITILCSVIVLLYLLSFFDLTQIKWLPLNQVDILSDVRVSKIKETKHPLIVVDTVKKIGTHLLPSDNTLIADYGLDSNNALFYFFEKLDKLKQGNGKVRLAYFGDSFIEGDYVTDELRVKLQETYGGNGLGFIPVQSIVEGEYNYLNFKSNHSWKDENFVNSSNSKFLGLTGHVFYANGTASSSYSLKKDKTMGLVKFYSGKLNAKIPVLSVIKDQVSQNISLNNSALINETIINQSPIHSLKIATADSRLPVYGISMEDSTGIYVDNYGFRGNTGVLTNKITGEVMKSFNAYLKYDLIIVHYGLNAIVHGQQKFTWFSNSQNALIQKLKQSFPSVPILIISTSDLGFKQGGEWITEPAVPYMVNTQRVIAQTNKVAFWDLYTSMGGENTIVSWAEQNPKLADMDYMHLNVLGAKKVSEVFYNKLIASKNYYQSKSLK